MARKQKIAKRPKPKTVLRLPDLEQSKNAVLNSLAAASSQESYGHAIDESIGWYCSEPRLAFNRSVVLRYRFFLEHPQTHKLPVVPCTAQARRKLGSFVRKNEGHTTPREIREENHHPVRRPAV